MKKIELTNGRKFEHKIYSCVVNKCLENKRRY